MQKTVVLIIDDQPIFRAGVRKALAHHNGLDVLEIVDCDPGQGQEAVLRTIEESSPHVALLDVQCSSGNGTELCKRIIRNHPSTRVVLLSSDPNADDLFDAMKIGAVAYLSKDSTVEILSDAIQRAASGE